MDAEAAGLLSSQEHKEALGCQAELMKCFYSSMKIKNTNIPWTICHVLCGLLSTGEGTSPRRVSRLPPADALMNVIKACYCLVLFPQYMAYACVMKLNRQQLDGKVVNELPSIYGLYQAV